MLSSLLLLFHATAKAADRSGKSVSTGAASSNDSGYSDLY